MTSQERFPPPPSFFQEFMADMGRLDKEMPSEDDLLPFADSLMEKAFKTLFGDGLGGRTNTDEEQAALERFFVEQGAGVYGEGPGYGSHPFYGTGGYWDHPQPTTLADPPPVPRSGTFFPGRPWGPLPGGDGVLPVAPQPGPWLSELTPPSDAKSSGSYPPRPRNQPPNTWQLRNQYLPIEPPKANSGIVESPKRKQPKSGSQDEVRRAIQTAKRGKPVFL